MEEDGFDGVCICTGTNTWASLPCFKGQECFKGEIMHSEKYRSAEVRQKYVLDYAWKLVLKKKSPRCACVVMRILSCFCFFQHTAALACSHLYTMKHDKNSKNYS